MSERYQNERKSGEGAKQTLRMLCSPSFLKYEIQLETFGRGTAFGHPRLTKETLAQTKALAQTLQGHPPLLETKMVEKLTKQEILLPSARHLEERYTVSQSVSQSGQQSVRQSVRQAGRQADRQKQTVWLFLVADYSYKQWGTIGRKGHSVVKWYNTNDWPNANSNPGQQFSDRRHGRSTHEPFFTRPWFKSL